MINTVKITITFLFFGFGFSFSQTPFYAENDYKRFTFNIESSLGSMLKKDVDFLDMELEGKFIYEFGGLLEYRLGIRTNISTGIQYMVQTAEIPSGTMKTIGDKISFNQLKIPLSIGFMIGKNPSIIKNGKFTNKVKGVKISTGVYYILNYNWNTSGGYHFKSTPNLGGIFSVSHAFNSNEMYLRYYSDFTTTKNKDLNIDIIQQNSIVFGFKVYVFGF